MNGSAATAAGLGGERPGYRPVTPNSRWVLGFRSLSLSLSSLKDTSIPPCWMWA